MSFVGDLMGLEEATVFGFGQLEPGTESGYGVTPTPGRGAPTRLVYQPKKTPAPSRLPGFGVPYRPLMPRKPLIAPRAPSAPSLLPHLPGAAGGEQAQPIPQAAPGMSREQYEKTMWDLADQMQGIKEKEAYAQRMIKQAMKAEAIPEIGRSAEEERMDLLNEASHFLDLAKLTKSLAQNNLRRLREAGDPRSLEEITGEIRYRKARDEETEGFMMNLLFPKKALASAIQQTANNLSFGR